MFTCTNIYITIMQKNFKFSKQIFDVKCYSTYGYNEFTYDFYSFLNNWSTLHYISIFNISLSGFIIFTVYLSHIEYILLIWCVTECTMCESFAQINSSMSFCTYTMMYYVCHLHVIYISDIYLSINCYWLKQFTTCYFCHFQNITTVYNWYLF